MRILFTLSFTGDNYCGWQVQENGTSVQQTVQDALERAAGKRLPLTGCSRTDSGVHALKFCCHTECDRLNIPVERLPAALNYYLPGDIAISSAAMVPDDFHARYDATAKTYHYRILNRPVRSPFETGRAYHVRAPLDMALISAAAEQLTGTHDFSAFCAAGSKVSDTTRTITGLSVTQGGGIVTIAVTADGFLYNMVRIIAGTLIEVGRKNIPPGSMGSIIQSHDRNNAGPTAPPYALYLYDVMYGI